MAKKTKPVTIAAYIAAAPKPAQARLREMRACLKVAAPGATESIKWGAPALSYKRILFIFAAFKNHISLVPTPAAIKAFSRELAKFETTAATIHFPLDRPLPLPLIRKIAAYRVRESREKDVKWM